MTLHRLGMIGCGGIADVALATLARELPSPLRQVSILVPAQFADQARALLDRGGDKLAASRAVHTDIGGLIADRPELVAECASHTAVRDHGAAILEAGCDLIVISIGALAHEELRTRLIQAARAGGARL